MAYTLSTAIGTVNGIGPTMEHRLGELDILTVKDLLYYIPFRYEDFTQLHTIASTPLDESVTIRASVRSITKFTSKRGLRIIRAVLEDETGKLPVMWFNQDYLLLTLKKGVVKQFSGKIKEYKGQRTFSSPVIEDIREGEMLHTNRLVPIYPETADITSRWLRTCIHHVLESIPGIPDSHNSVFLANHHLMPLELAIRTLHFPVSLDTIDACKHRLAFDEVFDLLTEARRRKQDQEKTKVLHRLVIQPKDVRQFEKALSYTLTASQLKTLLDMSLDLTAPHPANRLIQGEVGSGKTTIAAFALYAAALNGQNGVFVAPTQIVAQQHEATLSALFKPLGISVRKIIGGQGEVSLSPTVYIGTHALFTHAKELHPAVVVIDEEHRFGVEQRDIFLNLGKKKPHFITMTATPIPRTAALTVLADREVSYLEEIPEKKKDVITKVVSEVKRASALEWIDKEIETHRCQVFIVCPFIQQSEKETLASVASAEDMYKKIVASFPKRQVALLHGKMKKEQKERVFEQMKQGVIDILVATPLIEVGIDIPNASIMVIEGAERFGLAALHQLRGRVGRAGQKAYCLLFPSEDIGATRRLRLMEKCNDGNTLADMDLKLRGSGQILGTLQHGWNALRFASWFDSKLIEECKNALIE